MGPAKGPGSAIAPFSTTGGQWRRMHFDPREQRALRAAGLSDEELAAAEDAGFVPRPLAEKAREVASAVERALAGSD
jgi:hypothetical protein